MEEKREVYAVYDEKYIRVYQAYNQGIAEEAVRLQTFGSRFSLERMTWIKPSFLWMMYRCGWGEKEDQEHILAIDLHRETFDGLLERAVLTSYAPEVCDRESWRKALDETCVLCQWDPDKDTDGNPIGRAAIQIGIRGEALKDLVSNGIHRIEDITEDVKKMNGQRIRGELDKSLLPMERIYPVNDPNIRKRLNMDRFLTAEKEEKGKFGDSVSITQKPRKAAPCSCGCDEYEHKGRGKYVCRGCGAVYTFAALNRKSGG